MTLERLAALQWLVFIAACAWLLYLLAPILSPFVAAAILAYICNPAVGRMCALKMPRAPAVVLVMSTLLGALVLLVVILLPLLQSQAEVLMTRLPQWLETLRTLLEPQVQRYLGFDLSWDDAALKDLLLGHWQGAGEAAARTLPWISGGGTALLALLVNGVLIPVVMFYLLRDWPQLVARVDAIIPRRWHDKVTQLAAEVDTVLAEFLRGQLAVMVLMSVYYAAALWFAGLEFALPIGVVAGMLVFVPYLGMITGLALATLAALTQFGHLGAVLLVWGVFGTGQLLEGMLVTPWLVGRRIGLHPLGVIFALLAFGQLFGFFGVLFALPLSAALLVGLRHARAGYLASSLYRD